jgi:HAD superfamily hydrolase (TIGR01509 family)
VRANGSGIDAVVFDLGGVLADFGGVGPMRTLARIDTDAELWSRWLTCEWVRRFERGHCSADEFAVGLLEDWRIDVEPAAFLADFSDWLVGPYDGAAELVRDASAVAVVACLSNTNAVHWQAGAAQWPLLHLFDQTFLSFQLGMVKPDDEIFERVVTDLGTTPNRVLFLDDNELNVSAARRVGLQALEVRGVEEARAALVNRKVLQAG